MRWKIANKKSVMRVIVYAKPGAKKTRIEEIVPGKTYRVWIDASAKDNAANIRLQELLAEYFHTAKSRISIRHGRASKTKYIELEDKRKK